jgi:hypothetical protein
MMPMCSPPSSAASPAVNRNEPPGFRTRATLAITLISSAWRQVEHHAPCDGSIEGRIRERETLRDSANGMRGRKVQPEAREHLRPAVDPNNLNARGASHRRSSPELRRSCSEYAVIPLRRREVATNVS